MKRRILLPVLLLLVGLNIYGNIGYLPKEWYDSSADYWKVMKNGDIVDDGKDDEISFEDGRKTISYKGQGLGKQGSIAKYLGVTKSALNGALDKAGFHWDGKKWDAAGKTISADAILKVLVANGISPQSMPKEYSQLFEVQKKAAEQEKMKVAQEQAKWKAEHQDVLSKFKEGNPQVKELLKQSDKYFKDKKDVIYRSGCVFRDIQSVCEIASGTTLTRQQIVDIWDDATAKKYLTESGSIASEIAYEKIAELTLAKLGRTDIGFQFGKNSYGGNIVAYLGKMPYSNEDSHSAVYLSKDDGYKMKPFYNPGQTNAKTYADKWKEIYIYGKKK